MDFFVSIMRMMKRTLLKWREMAGDRMFSKVRRFCLNLKFFNKIFIAFSFIVVVVLISLSAVVTNNITSMLVEKEVQYNKFVLINLNTFLQGKLDLVRQLTKQTNLQSFDEESMVYDFFESSLDDASPEYQSMYSGFSKYFESKFSQDRDISIIYTYKPVNDKLFMFSKYSLPGTFEKKNFKYPERLEQVKDLSPVIRVYPSNHPFYSTYEYTYSMGITIKTTDTFAPIGLMMVDFEVSGIDRLIRQYYETKISDTIILTATGDVIYDSTGKYYGKTYPYMSSLDGNHPSERLDNEKCLINVNSDNDAKVLIAGITPEKQILKRVKSTQRTIFFISFVFLFSALVLVYLGAQGFSKRVERITSTMREVKNGDFSVRIPLVESKDEINEIAESFNSMCSELEGYIDKVYVSELNQKNSELKQKSAQLMALQSQINPHFLYNTLEAIRMMANREGARDASQMILILSILFRDTVKEDPLIEIEEEIEHLKLYLDLFKIRYGERLHVEFDIDSDILKYGVSRHLIQPIIENYLMHGFDSSILDNRLRFEGHMEGEFIVFYIIDNGLGIDENRILQIKEELLAENSKSTGSIGISNVHERIRLMYGQQCGLDIESNPGKQTRISIRILAKTKKELENNV